MSLRAAGIPVLTSFQYPILYVSLQLMTVTDQSSLYLYSIRVELNQFVRPTRHSSVQPVRGITWQTLQIGTVGRDHLSDVRGVIKDAVNQFVNDYLTANPRR